METGNKKYLKLQQNIQDQKDEIVLLQSMFPGRDELRIISDQSSSLLSNFSESCEYSDLASKKEDETFIIEIAINVQLGDHGITVNVSLPCTKRDQKSTENDLPKAANRLEYERTVSGHHWSTSFQVNYLTPIILKLMLPPCYPSDEPPLFTVTCQWLRNDQLDVLGRQLDGLWSESPGMPIIYTWIDWLQHSALNALEIEDNINLGHSFAYEKEETSTTEMDNSTEKTVLSLLSHNEEQQLEAFMHTVQICPICYEEKMGSSFLRLGNCQHHFCVDCLTSYCELHVKDGTVVQLMCPEIGCKTVLPPNVLQAVLQDETLQRWERLAFQNGLDTMSDIKWCPRCNRPVIQEKEEEIMLAHCMSCFYSFCTKCMEPWHLGSKCLHIETTSSLEEHSSIDMHRNIESAKSLHWINTFSKPCPSCQSPVEKESGCNKLTCSRCLADFCWICGEKISGYEHFGVCNLWTQATFVPVHRPAAKRRNKLPIHQNDGQEQFKVKKCPNCKQVNPKNGRDNHILCFYCHTHFCFLCSSVLPTPITSHYTYGNPCRQHSD